MFLWFVYVYVMDGGYICCSSLWEKFIHGHGSSEEEEKIRLHDTRIHAS